MTKYDFLNRIRSLYNIDRFSLPELDDEAWKAFRVDPPRYLIKADKRDAHAILREVEKRQTVRELT